MRSREPNNTAFDPGAIEFVERGAEAFQDLVVGGSHGHGHISTIQGCNVTLAGKIRSAACDHR
jgi:hypothetical protein